LGLVAPFPGVVKIKLTAVRMVPKRMFNPGPVAQLLVPRLVVGPRLKLPVNR
jgi:hypothetical protein